MAGHFGVCSRLWLTYVILFLRTVNISLAQPRRRAPTFCQPPQNPPFGVLSGSSTKWYSKWNVKCNIGYSMDSNVPQTTSCQPDGTWSLLQRPCIPDCPLPQNPPFGVLSGSSTGVNAAWSVTCNSGYKIDSSVAHTTYCQRNATWTQLQMPCIPNCQVPRNPHFSELVGSSTITNALWNVTCNLGYHMDASVPQTTVCQRNGQWSPLQMPCIRIALIGHRYCSQTATILKRSAISSFYSWTQAKEMCELNNGRLLTEDAHHAGCTSGLLTAEHIALMNAHNKGVVKTTAGHSHLMKDRVYTVCEFDCLRTAAEDHVASVSPEGNVTCDLGFEDTHNQPVCSLTHIVRPCTPIKCGTPEKPHGGSLSGWNPQTYGSRVIVFCYVGYRANTSVPQQTTCQLNGTWSPLNRPCIPIDCGQPGNPPFGTLSSSNSTTFEAIWHVTCDTGYKANNSVSQTTTCRDNGIWSPLYNPCIVKIGPRTLPSLVVGEARPATTVLTTASSASNSNGMAGLVTKAVTQTHDQTSSGLATKVVTKTHDQTSSGLVTKAITQTHDQTSSSQELRSRPISTTTHWPSHAVSTNRNGTQRAVSNTRDGSRVTQSLSKTKLKLDRDMEKTKDKDAWLLPVVYSGLFVLAIAGIWLLVYLRKRLSLPRAVDDYPFNDSTNGQYSLDVNDSPIGTARSSFKLVTVPETDDCAKDKDDDIMLCEKYQSIMKRSQSLEGTSSCLKGQLEVRTRPDKNDDSYVITYIKHRDIRLPSRSLSLVSGDTLDYGALDELSSNIYKEIPRPKKRGERKAGHVTKCYDNAMPPTSAEEIQVYSAVQKKTHGPTGGESHQSSTTINSDMDSNSSNDSDLGRSVTIRSNVMYQNSKELDSSGNQTIPSNSVSMTAEPEQSDLYVNMMYSDMVPPRHGKKLSLVSEGSWASNAYYPVPQDTGEHN
ncbi:uncharacterized protein LOC135827344 isoform X2 [Sycon ciliatum]|uniref:uncharacterized protein LOC135827344 isoform X2 n=1 Tax=Sycon ciliatum TaxID=27933 RepID=UPI0031F60F0F